MRTAAAIGVLLLLAAMLPGRPWGRSQESFKPLRGPYMGQEAPIRPTVFLPGKISTGGNEGSSLFFPGARSFLWMTGRGGQDSVLLLEDKDGRWQPPHRIDLFGDGTDVRDFTIAPDGEWMYFASNRRTAGPGGGNIWRVRVESGDWSTPELLPSTVNGDEDEGYPSVTRQGELYFSRRGVANPSDSELWVAGRWNGRYRSAVRLRNPLNGPYADFDPFIAPDGRYLIFASRRPGGLGGSDLYISHRDPGDVWSRPVNLGAGINSPADEARPVVTLDGRFFFFTSNRPSSPQLPPGMPPGGSMPGNGSFDIWWTTTDLLPLNGGRLQDATVDAAAGRGFAGSRRPNRLAVGPSDRPGGRRTRADQAPRRGRSVESTACGQAGGGVPSGSAQVPYLGQPPPGDRPVVFAPGLISDAGYRLRSRSP